MEERRDDAFGSKGPTDPMLLWDPPTLLLLLLLILADFAL